MAPATPRVRAPTIAHERRRSRPARIRSRTLVALSGLVAGLATAACQSDAVGPTPTNDPATLAVELSRAYEVDAARLAVRHVRAISAAPIPPVEVSEALAGEYHDALLAVWSLDHPARDSVVRLNEIHTFPEPALREIIVAISPGSRLDDAWAVGRTLTDEPAADELIQRYRLKLESYRAILAGSPYAVLRSDTLLDAGALALRFRAVPGVTGADANSVVGDGNDIVAREVGGALFLDYSVGWGDCPAGCIQRHTWTFRVEGGRATYVGSSGPPYWP